MGAAVRNGLRGGEWGPASSEPTKHKSLSFGGAHVLVREKQINKKSIRYILVISAMTTKTEKEAREAGRGGCHFK